MKLIESENNRTNERTDERPRTPLVIGYSATKLETILASYLAWLFCLLYHLGESKIACYISSKHAKSDRRIGGSLFLYIILDKTN